MFKIFIAKPRGFCAGVERAIEIVELALLKFGKPVYVRHEIVHNEKVVSDLRKKGVIFVEDPEEVPEGNVIIFSAHGVSPLIIEKAKKRNLKIIDATCPLVTKVHLEAINFTNKGYRILLIGHKGHVEVEGTLGYAPENIEIIENLEDIKKLKFNKNQKYAVLTQTTLSVDDTREIIKALKQKIKNLETPSAEDICYATQNRQDVVKKIAPFVDVFLVIGSKKSSNSNRLKEVAEKSGTKAFLINDEKEIPIKEIKKAKAVGVTSGASTPESIVKNVINKLKKLGGKEIKEIIGTEENIKFKLPSELK